MPWDMWRWNLVASVVALLAPASCCSQFGDFDDGPEEGVRFLAHSRSWFK